MSQNRLRHCLNAVTAILLLWSSLLYADAAQDIDAILAREKGPLGVVFEIAQSQESALQWAAPQIKAYAQRLRERFPNLKISVVTHGKEEFALLASNAEQYGSVHSAMRELVNDQDIPVHVCGTHASWFDKHPEDFPDYIDVAPSGPAQIQSYRDLGYLLVVLRRP